MKSLNIDRGGHLLSVNDQHHVVKNLPHPLIVSQIHFACIFQLHLVSRLPQHMFALLSSENFLRKWGSVSGSGDVMPAFTGTGSSPLRTHCVELFMSLPNYSSLVLYIWLLSKTLKQFKEFEEFLGNYLFPELSSDCYCQNVPGQGWVEAAEADVCLGLPRRHTTHQVKKP